jgi:hypothetical protein
MNRELIMQTLFELLTAPPLVFGFTADVFQNDAVLHNVSDTSGLFAGMPVAGTGIAPGTRLLTLDPEPTLSIPAQDSQAQAALTQGFQTYSRRLKAWSDVANQPAFFLVDYHEIYPGMTATGGAPAREDTSPARINLQARGWIYVNLPDPAAVPGSSINPLLDGIEEALKPSRGVWQNLGLKGVVHCRIEGTVLKDAGAIDGQVICQIPIVIQAMQAVDTVPL